MNFSTTLALGGFAGGTVLLGLPVARLRTLSQSARVLLAGRSSRPSWRYLLFLVAIGGGTPFLVTSPASLSSSGSFTVFLLPLAASPFLSFLFQLRGFDGRASRSDLVSSGVLTGLLARF